jgi:hypothetical protein
VRRIGREILRLEDGQGDEDKERFLLQPKTQNPQLKTGLLSPFPSPRRQALLPTPTVSIAGAIGAYRQQPLAFPPCRLLSIAGATAPIAPCLPG